MRRRDLVPHGHTAVDLWDLGNGTVRGTHGSIGTKYTRVKACESPDKTNRGGKPASEGRKGESSAITTVELEELWTSSAVSDDFGVTPHSASVRKLCTGCVADGEHTGG